MKSNDFIQELIDEIVALVKVKYNEESAVIKADVIKFVNESKEKLLRWNELLQAQQLTLEEFSVLVNSQKDLFIMESLYKAGISRISLGHFKNSIVSVIINTTVRLLL